MTTHRFYFYELTTPSLFYKLELEFNSLGFNNDSTEILSNVKSDIADMFKIVSITDANLLQIITKNSSSKVIYH